MNARRTSGFAVACAVGLTACLTVTRRPAAVDAAAEATIAPDDPEPVVVPVDMAADSAAPRGQTDAAADSPAASPDTRPPVTAKDAAGPPRPGYRVGWIATIGTPTGSPVYDGTGFYVAGVFRGVLDLGGVELASAPDPPPDPMKSTFGQSSFVAKYTTEGKLLWAKKYGLEGVTSIKDLAVDNNGDLAVVGEFNARELKLDAVVLPALPERSRFAARLSPSGSVVWAVDPGSYGNVAQFDGRGNTLLGGSANHLFQRRDRSGQMVGLVNVTGDSAYSTGIEHDASSNIYVCGGFNGTFDLETVQVGEKQFVAQGGRDVFLAKFDASDRPIWGAMVGTENPDDCTHLRLDAVGNPVLGTVGYINDGVGNFNANTLVTKFDANTGKPLWTRTIKTVLRAMDVADNGDVVVALAGVPPIDLGTGMPLLPSIMARLSAATGDHVASVPYGPRVIGMVRGPSGSFVVSGLDTLISLADLLPP